MNEDTGALGLAFDYQTCNFATDRVREIAAVYERVLETMARWPEKRQRGGEPARRGTETAGASGGGPHAACCVHETLRRGRGSRPSASS